MNKVRGEMQRTNSGHREVPATNSLGSWFLTLDVTGSRRQKQNFIMKIYSSRVDWSLPLINVIKVYEPFYRTFCSSRLSLMIRLLGIIASFTFVKSHFYSYFSTLLSDDTLFDHKKFSVVCVTTCTITRKVWSNFF